MPTVEIRARGALRIIRATEIVEKMIQNPPPDALRYGGQDTTAASKFAYVNSGGLTAANTTAVPFVPGTGSVRLWDYAGGVGADSGIDVTVLTWDKPAVPSGTLVRLSLIDGEWFATGVPC